MILIFISVGRRRRRVFRAHENYHTQPARTNELFIGVISWSLPHDEKTSKRSRFITRANAAAKSLTNMAWPSSQA